MTSAPSAQFIYDPAGRLLQAAKTAVGARRFGYDGGEIIAEFSTANVMTKRFVRGPLADEVLVEEDVASGAQTWLLHDERGSIIAGANASGTISYFNRYDAYGKPASANQGSFQFTGQLYLTETEASGTGSGLYYFKARIYNPKFGRFMQADPIGYGDGLNMYAYTGGDPINFTDPSGKFGFAGCAIGAGLGLIGSIVSQDSREETVRNLAVGCALGLVGGQFARAVSGAVYGVFHGVVLSSRTSRVVVAAHGAAVGGVLISIACATGADCTLDGSQAVIGAINTAAGVVLDLTRRIIRDLSSPGRRRTSVTITDISTFDATFGWSPGLRLNGIGSSLNKSGTSVIISDVEQTQRSARKGRVGGIGSGGRSRVGTDSTVSLIGQGADFLGGSGGSVGGRTRIEDVETSENAN